MSAAESWTPSRRLQSAAAAESDRIQRELERVQAREADLRRELVLCQQRRQSLEAELAVLARFAEDDEGLGEIREQRSLRLVGSGATGSVAATASSGLATAADPDDPQVTVLRGMEIRETAIRLLVERGEVDQPIHYRTWYEILRRAGYLPQGKDPLATFLTQIGRSPLVERTTSQGVYCVQTDFPIRAQKRLETLQHEAAELDHPRTQSTIDELDAARQRRSALANDIEAIERALAEAHRSLGR